MAEKPMTEMLEQQKYAIDPGVFEQLETAVDNENIARVREIFLEITLFDVIDFLISTHNEIRKIFLLAVQDILDPMLFIEIDEELLFNVIEILGIENTANIANKLDSEHLIYLINKIDEDIRCELIPFFPRFIQLEIYQNLVYPEESAGRLANKNFIAVLENWTIENVLDFLQEKKDKLPERFYQIFVVDNNMKPLGSCELRDILLLSNTTMVSEIMDREIKTVTAETEQEEVAYILRKYALFSIPVINEKGAIVGLINFDDIVDVIEEEADEDMYYMGGLSENDIHSSVAQTVRKRLPWLLINMGLASITSTFIGLFEGVIERVVVLASLMPLIASTGGNSGLQTVTVMVKSIANRDITKQNVWRIFFKEIVSGIFNGICLAFCASLIIFFIFHKSVLSILFGCAIVAVFFISNFLATCVPLLLNRCNIDPAISSSVIITTMTDISSVLIFFGLATMIL